VHPCFYCIPIATLSLTMSIYDSTRNKAERGHIPNIFTKRSKYGTPTVGIIFNTLVIIVFSCADFGQLLQLLNSVYAMALLMEYAAFVKLRLYHKECTFLCCLLPELCARTFFLLHPCSLPLLLQCNDRIVFRYQTGRPS
jgi:hypothetical protein